MTLWVILAVIIYLIMALNAAVTIWYRHLWCIEMYGNPQWRYYNAIIHLGIVPLLWPLALLAWLFNYATRRTGRHQ